MAVPVQAARKENKMEEGRIILFGPKCPYCKGKNLYLKRTSPVEQYGCRDCERKIEKLRAAGMSDREIKDFFKRE